VVGAVAVGVFVGPAELTMTVQAMFPQLVALQEVVVQTEAWLPQWNQKVPAVLKV